MINRLILLPKKDSFFLFGPRQTGKTSLVLSQFGREKGLWKVDLLLNDLFFKYSKTPSLFRYEAEEKIAHGGVRRIFVDEVQRIPLILNEIQALMAGHPGVQFILTGSSARKLKRGGANLLGGRAFERHLHPFVYQEIKDSFKLDEILQFGSLPAAFGQPTGRQIDILTAYANIYLREEIQSEGIVRNLGGFSRFLDMAAAQCGELVNFSSIARDCHLSARSVLSYYEILEDTLIGFRLEPWARSPRKRMVEHPKFYFFDLGVTNAINKRLKGEPDSVLRGRLFEQFVILEAKRMIDYKQSEANIYFWRTNHGGEVDLLIEKHGKVKSAFEIKSSGVISGAHLSGLRSFHKDHPHAECGVISQADHVYRIDGIKVWPWQKFLEELEELL